MSWSLNSITIYVQDYNGSNPNIIARIQPLSGGTVLQQFGYENEIKKVSGIIVGNTDRDALKSYAKTHSTYQLNYVNGTSLGSFYVKSFNWKQIPVVCQTMRPDLDSDAPVYQVELELYE